MHAQTLANFSGMFCSVLSLTRETNRFPNSIDLRIMQAVGENLQSAIRNEINILEAMVKDNMLTNFYAYALGMERYLLDLTRIVGQISRRFPHINVLEIGEFGRTPYYELSSQVIDSSNRGWYRWGYRGNSQATREFLRLLHVHRYLEWLFRKSSGTL